MSDGKIHIPARRKQPVDVKVRKISSPTWENVW